MFRYPLQPYPHIQYPVAPILQENFSDQKIFNEVDYQDISEEREPLLVIEKSLDSLSLFLVVGSLLSAMITGSLASLEQYVECPDRDAVVITKIRNTVFVREGPGILCTAITNKLATVLASVWLPIITFCLLRYHKSETVNQNNSRHRDFVNK